MFFSKKMRKRHHHNFKRAFINQNEHSLDFWKLIEDKVNIELRFTSSDDYSIGYIDFLDIKKTKDSYEGPNIPITFIA